MEPQKPTTSALSFDTNDYLAQASAIQIPACFDPSVNPVTLGIPPKVDYVDPKVIEKKKRQAALICSLLVAILLLVSTLIIIGICKLFDVHPPFG